MSSLKIDLGVLLSIPNFTDSLWPHIVDYEFVTLCTSRRVLNIQKSSRNVNTDYFCFYFEYFL